MASLFDRFFKRSTLQKDQPRDISLSDAVSLVRKEAEGRISPEYPAFHKLCTAILGQATEAKKAAKGVGEGKLDKALPQYQIGLQMQRNFVERVPSILDALTTPEKNYASYARFHAAALETVKSVAKISNDNRYLPFFLSNEIGAFGKRMNLIVKLTDELGTALAMEKESVDWINSAQQLEIEIRTRNDEIRSLVRLKNETAERRIGLEKEISSALAKNEETEQEKNAIRQRIDSLRNQMSAEKKRLTDQLSPFQRQFRKLQKRILEKDVSNSLEAYTEQPEKTAIGEMAASGDYPSLRKILSEMKIALEQGELEDDEKIRTRRLASIGDMLDGSLTAPAKHTLELGKELAKEEAALSTASKRTIHVEELQKKMAHDTEQLASIEKEEAGNRERIEASFIKMESLVKEAIDETVRINRKLEN